MIRIKKPAAPAILKRCGPAATKDLCDSYDRGDRAFDFDNRLYGAESVKKALIKAQHGKCAFCESIFTVVSFGDVEHFRPKGGHQQRSGDPVDTPGYYWLAYEWSNLYASCQICNQRHKRNLFPLENPDDRARSHHHQLDAEKCLFIDCGAEDPGEFIGFHEECAFAIDGNPRGRVTIEALGLNRSELVEERRKQLDLIELLWRTMQLLIDRLPTADEIDGPGIADLRIELNDYFLKLAKLTSDEGEYSSMARAAFRGT